MLLSTPFTRASPHGNVYSGKGYVCLRDEFLITQPSEDSDEVRRILVTFGGTDPLDLTARVYELAKRHNAEAVDVTFDFVLGSGYDNPAVQSVPECGIEVSRNVLRMSDHMRKADMLFPPKGAPRSSLLHGRAYNCSRGERTRAAPHVCSNG